MKCDGVEIWSITSAKAQPQIGRGDILVMPALTVTPYYAYVMDDIGTRWPGSDKAICVSDVNAWPGIKSTISTTVEGNTYKNGYEYDGGVVEKHTDRSKADVYAYATPSK